MSEEFDSGLLPGRNPFLDLVPDPDKLSHRGRVDVVRRLAGRLQAAEDRESVWFGRRLTAWLSGPPDGDLVGALGLRPPPGSHLSAPAILAREKRDIAMLELAVAAGSYRAALRLLKSGDVGPEWAELANDPPKSEASFTRALKRVSPPSG